MVRVVVQPQPPTKSRLRAEMLGLLLLINQDEDKHSTVTCVTMGRSKLTERSLNKCGIFYDSQPSSLPPHIDNLKSNLLDFDCTVFGNLGELAVDLSCQQLKREFWRSECKEPLELVHKSTARAIALTTRQDRESEWQEYFAKYFCDSLISAAEITDGDDRR